MDKKERNMNFEEILKSGFAPSQDSRNVKKGEIYFCLTDDEVKTRERVAEALERGAEFAVSNFDLGERCIKVADAREDFALFCKNFYKSACDDMKMIAVSGTNGKTSTSHIVAEMLRRNGKKVGVVGTNGVFFDGQKKPCPLTTPDADFLHRTFLDMKNAGVEYVVMEVSAHAIDQKRTFGILFDVGVLTNITQDHLDYFGTMENYEKTKLSFFNHKNMKFAIFCMDDERAKKLLLTCDIPSKSYGINSPSDTFAMCILCAINGSRFVANVEDSVLNIKTNLVGEYNVYNCLAALEVCKRLGLSDKELELGLNFINPVEGRFNVINFFGKYVVVDFAHTPDGILNVLKTARKMTNRKLFIIFGCGGNRDKTKRPQMGEIAEKYADYVCLTNDNPRFEKPLDIISDIEKGMKKPHLVECDRKKAIKRVLSIAGKDDIIIVAGKGAEKYQEIEGTKHEYNDFDAILQCMRETKREMSEKEKVL